MTDGINESNEDDFSNATSSTEDFFPAAAQTLPMELVLRILDAVALNCRDSCPARAVSLSLVSRAVRASVLPIIYDVLVLRIQSHDNDVGGWDDRGFDSVRVAFLSWLLCNPFAPPRRHIKHLVFHHSYMFSGSEIEPRTRAVADQDGSTSDASQAGVNQDPLPRWTLDNLVVAFPSDATELRIAGIQARVTHWLAGVVPHGDADWGSLSKRAVGLGNALHGGDPQSRNCVRIWTRPETADNQPLTASKLWAGALQYQQIDTANDNVGIAAPDDQRGVSVFIDLGEHEGFGELSDTLIDEMVAIFWNGGEDTYRVVLVYPTETQEEDLQLVARCLRTGPHHLAVELHERVYIAVSSWPDRSLMAKHPQSALARVIQLGVDPWEMGCRLVDFVLS